MALSTRAAFILLLTATVASTALAAGAADSSSPTSTSSIAVQASCTLPEPGLPFCSFEGQADFYGLGVRMGIYFTWLTSWIANNFIPDEISGSLDTNAVFLLAISTTVIYNSIHHSLRIVDALVLLQLCYGFLFGVMSLWGYRTMYYHRMGFAGRSQFGGFGTHLRLMLMTAISGYAVWFWFEGMDDGLIECNKREACGGLVTFFFARVKLYGWIRTFYKISAVGCVAYYGIMTVTAAVWLTVRSFKFLRYGRKGWTEGYAEKESLDIGLTRRELSYAYLAIAFFNFCWMLFCALTVEFTLNWNHMTNVLGEHGLSGPGQQIPLLIGMLSFLRICWIFIKNNYIEPSFHPDEELQTTSASVPESTTTSTAPPPTGLGISASRANTTTSIQPAPTPTPVRRAATTTTSPAPARFPANQHTHLNSIPLLASHTNRPWLQRFLVAYLPWIADFAYFRNRLRANVQGQGFEPVGGMEAGAGVEMQKSTTTTARTSEYYDDGGRRKGGGNFDVDVESLGSKGKEGR